MIQCSVPATETYDHEPKICENMQDAKQNSLTPISILLAQRLERSITPLEAMVK